MLNKTILATLFDKLITINPWHFTWISIIISEIMTGALSSLVAFLLLGQVPLHVLIIGAIDALIVSFVIVGLIVYFIHNSKRLSLLLDEKTHELREVNKCLSEANKNKDIFLTNISHELRTPLTLVLTPLEEMLQDPARFDEHDYITMEKMHTNGLSLLRQINDLLDLTRLQDGRMSLRFKQADIVGLIETIIARVTATAEQKDIQITLQTSGNFNDLYLDPDKFEKVIINLVSNALKFTPHSGQIAINLTGKNSEINIDVSDTGIGIPQDRLEAVFERFVQVDGSNSRRYGGTGIGLSLVKDIVELHGGKVSVSSEEGKGSTFHLQLRKGSQHIQPEDIVDQDLDTGDEIEALKYSNLVKSSDLVVDADQDISELVARLQQCSTASTKVLIVEDKPEMYQLLGDVLHKDYKIEIAHNGEQGLEKAHVFKPDLIVSDVMMPVKTGIEMLSDIRHDDGLKHTPVILLSAKAEVSNKISGLEVGANDYIAKPFNPRELKARIQALINQKKLQAEVMQSAKLASLGTLSAGIAHEIKNSLNYIKGTIKPFERLSKKFENEQDRKKADKLIEVMNQGMNLTLDIIESIATFTGVDNRAKQQDVNIKKLISGVLNILKHKLHSQIQVNVEVDENLECFVDTVALSQVLMNLCGNAADAMETGIINIKAEKQQENLHIQVADNGCGMDQATLDRIFDPFYTTKSVGSGTGLGLHIVKSEIEKRNGTIKVESTEGVGTTFTINLPLETYKSEDDTEIRQAS